MKAGRIVAAVVLVIVIAAAYCGYAITRATPAVALVANTTPTVLNQTPAKISWPAVGEAAVSVANNRISMTHGTQRKSPTASVAKVMIALQVLAVKPLKSSTDQGPTITITQTDVDDYQNWVALEGSVAAVSVGEQITERQALEGLMLPSANNLADTLARWAFGSATNYVAKANAAAVKLGMANTHIADPSGFSPDTVSTAADLIQLGRAALANPALAAIVAEKTAVLPVAGLVNNVNTELGIDGIIGIKTGNTDQAGGVFLFAAQIAPAVGVTPVLLIAAVMAAPDLPTALADAAPLIDSVRNSFSTAAVTLSTSGPVAARKAAWGQQITATASAASVALLHFNGHPITVTTALDEGIKVTTKGQRVGRLHLDSGFATADIPVLLDDAPSAPASYKLLHP